MNVADYYSKAHVTFLTFSRTAIFAHEHQCLTILMCLIPPKYSAEMISDVEEFDERLEAGAGHTLYSSPSSEYYVRIEERDPIFDCIVIEYSLGYTVDM